MWSGLESKENVPEWRGFWDGVDLYLGAMCRLWEREREREISRKVPSQRVPQKWKRKCMYAWNVHEHVTCKENYIMGSTQSNPNSTQVSTIMHETLWKCKCNAMHEHITSYKQNPTQKFHKILKDFQKPQKFQEKPKPRSKCMKCMKKEILEKHTKGKTQGLGQNPSGFEV